MFLIHGIRRIELSGHMLPGPCPNCGTDGSVQLFVLQPYVHLFWLPLFPLPRRGRTKCMSCGHEVKHGQLPLQTKLLFGDLKRIGRTPIWTFTGAAILAIVLPLFVRHMSTYSDEQAALLEKPLAGDIWTVELGDKWYTLYKVEEVRSDSVFVRKNMRDVQGGILALVKFQSEAVNDFTGERIGYARSEIPELDRRGPLHGVSRNPGTAAPGGAKAP